MRYAFPIAFRFRKFYPTLRFRNLVVPVDGPHISPTVFKHLWKGGYEKPEIDALSALLCENDRVLELGAGMGIVSGVVAQHKKNLSFQSYEANPDLIRPIKHLHKLNGIVNIDVRNEILLPTSDATPIRFNIHENFTESSLNENVQSESSVEVPVRDFRKVLEEFAPNILVCDIEGAEAELFQDVDLSGLRALVIELHPRLISRQATKKIYDLCMQAGLYPRVELSSHQVVAFEQVR